MLSLLGIPKRMIIVSWTTAGGGQSCIRSDSYSLESDALKMQTRAKKQSVSEEMIIQAWNQHLQVV